MAHQSCKNEDTRTPTSSTPWTATNQPSMVTPTRREQPIWTVDDNQQMSYHTQNAPTISVVDCCGNGLTTPPANRNVDARNVLPPLPPLRKARQAQAGDTRQVVNSVQPLIRMGTVMGTRWNLSRITLCGVYPFVDCGHSNRKRPGGASATAAVI